MSRDYDNRPVNPGREALKGLWRNHPEEGFKANMEGRQIAVLIVLALLGYCFLVKPFLAFLGF